MKTNPLYNNKLLNVVGNAERTVSFTSNIEKVIQVLLNRVGVDSMIQIDLICGMGFWNCQKLQNGEWKVKIQARSRERIITRYPGVTKIPDTFILTHEKMIEYCKLFSKKIIWIIRYRFEDNDNKCTMHIYKRQ